MKTHLPHLVVEDQACAFAEERQKLREVGLWIDGHWRPGTRAVVDTTNCTHTTLSTCTAHIRAVVDTTNCTHTTLSTCTAHIRPGMRVVVDTRNSIHTTPSTCTTQEDSLHSSVYVSWLTNYGK